MEENHKTIVNELKEKLEKHKKSDIIITEHAEIRALERDIDLDEVKENIVNPIRLVYAKELDAQKEGEFKYECYFNYSKGYCHKYILTTNSKVIIVTIININRDWQRSVK
ncbi:MAG: hypothetical protein ACP5NZ_02025 [Nanobdellota archaeon]